MIAGTTISQEGGAPAASTPTAKSSPEPLSEAIELQIDDIDASLGCWEASAKDAARRLGALEEALTIWDQPAEEVARTIVNQALSGPKKWIAKGVLKTVPSSDWEIVDRFKPEVKNLLDAAVVYYRQEREISLKAIAAFQSVLDEFCEFQRTVQAAGEPELVTSGAEWMIRFQKLSEAADKAAPLSAQETIDREKYKVKTEAETVELAERISTALVNESSVLGVILPENFSEIVAARLKDPGEVLEYAEKLARAA